MRDGLEIISEYKRNREYWYPMIDHIDTITPDINEFGDINIGFNAGMLDPDRPFFAECWATNGITVITIFVSDRDLDVSDTELVRRIQDTGYLKIKQDMYSVEVAHTEDSNHNTFFSVNITAGYGRKTYIEGGKVYPFEKLNAYIEQSHRS